jgi:2,3-dihydroxy-p-cumate/2,3-dihydroxybenzoate 3,4-dioxygenase
MRYLNISYVSLNVTNLQESTKFYDEIVGLHLTEQRDNQSFFTSSNAHFNIILNQAEQAGLDRVAFEVESAEEMEQAFDRLKKLGLDPQEVSQEECRSLLLNGAFRIKDPNGYTIELHNGLQEHDNIFKPWPVRITRLGHLVVNTPNFEETLKFYTNTLNFKVSDYKYGREGKISFAFMRCFPSPYHHSFAAFMVEDIDDIGRAVNHLKKHEIPILNGPGRHVASGSIFLYYKDPDGLMVEYTLGMEEFPEVNPRKPRILDGTPYTSNMWLVR